MAGIEMTHVPYRGAGPAMNDLMPGRVSAMFSNLPGVIPQILGKSVRGLAVTSRRRVAAVPDIPTIGETVPGYEVESWWGLFAPAATPPAIIEKLHADTVAALAHEFGQAALRGDRRSGQRVHAGRACGTAAFGCREMGADCQGRRHQAGVGVQCRREASRPGADRMTGSCARTIARALALPRIESSSTVCPPSSACAFSLAAAA